MCLPEFAITTLNKQRSVNERVYAVYLGVKFTKREKFRIVVYWRNLFGITCGEQYHLLEEMLLICPTLNTTLRDYKFIPGFKKKIGTLTAN